MTGWRGLERFSFSDSPAIADGLAALVLAASDGMLTTHPDRRMIMLDGSGRPGQ